MTTHILEVAERMADRIGVIAGGRLIAEGTLDELRVPSRQGPRPASRTRSSPSSPSRQPRREPARHARLVRAHHELRLAWRDWLSMMTAGRRRRVRTSWRSRLMIFVIFMHFSPIRLSSRSPTSRHDPDKTTLVVITGSAAAVLVADDVAGDGIGDARVLRALRPRSDPFLAGRGAADLRGSHRHDGALDRPDGGAAGAPFINVLVARGGARWLGAYGV